jgi:excisionase family DNA binding protein
MTLDLGQAANLLKLHPQTVLQRARAGEIPAAKPGKRWVFIEEDLLNWLRSQYNCRRDAGQGGQALCSLKEKTQKNILGTLHRPKRRARSRLDWD